MGATLSVVNDAPRSHGCQVTVWTIGRGFVVKNQYVMRKHTIELSLARVWYDIEFNFNNEHCVTKRVWIQEDHTIHLADVYPKLPPLVIKDSDDNVTVRGSDHGSETQPKLQLNLQDTDIGALTSEAT